MDNKEKFRGLCQEVLPLINGIAEAVKRNGYEAMASLTIDGDDYFAFSIHGSDWKMGKVNGGPVNMCYEFKEEIQLQDQRQEKMIYNKASENLRQGKCLTHRVSWFLCAIHHSVCTGFHKSIADRQYLCSP